jgi:hypothetical protein
MIYVAYAPSGLAILVMGIDVVLTLRLRRAIVGGEVGEQWNLLTVPVVFFFFGYLLSPLALFFQIPTEYLCLLVFGVFLFGAVFVWVVNGVIRQALTFMKLLK